MVGEGAMRESPDGDAKSPGWCVNGNASMTPTFGVLASSETYGHTGWTGALTFIDPVNHMAIVILGNRPYSVVTDLK